MGSMSPEPGTPFAYAYASDAESGQLPRRLARRFLTKRLKVIASVSILTVLFIFFNDGLFSTRPYLSAGGGHVDNGRKTAGSGGLQGIWEAEDVVEPKGWGGWGFGPFKKPDSKPVSKPAIQKPESYIAPAHPDINALPLPKDIMSDFPLTSLRPPTIDVFPDTRLREIISPPEPRLSSNEEETPPFPEGNFAESWKAPSGWDGPRGEIRKVQWEGFAGGRDRWESAEEKAIREERRDAVKRAFGYAWQSYKDHAWGHDEVRPVTKLPSDPFNNWGASIVDTLDTLLVMGLSEEYNLCRPHVNQINFHWMQGRDWANGFTSEAPPTDDEETPSETWTVNRDPFVGLPVFETSIRYLGGLLGAYDLSGDQLLLDRAIDLADILSKAFNTESGLPAARIDPGAEPSRFYIGQVSIAEAGSMSLEFIRLSQITGNRTYFDLVQRTMDFLEKEIIPKSKQSPLIPLYIYLTTNAEFINGAYAFGGLADSYYEYLIKTYKLLGGSKIAEGWKRIYEASIDKAKEVLYTTIDYIPKTPLLAIGKLEGGRLIPEIEHLTCFAGAMLGIGAKLLDRQGDMKDAEEFTQSCYWLSAATHTGLQPEVVEFWEKGEDPWEEIQTFGGKVKKLEVPDGSNTYEDEEGVLRWNIDGSEVDLEGGEGVGEEGSERKLKGRLPGSKKVVGRGLNRPETIESIFYMYRLTGDRKWQEKGWKMFVSWIQTAKTAGGISSIEDVTREIGKLRFSDNMESFAFAETFKYHYLLQSEPDLLSLDDYVLNTEAHPLIANPDMSPGSGRFWNPPADPNADLGVRGQGTHAQKWQRLGVLQSSRGVKKNDHGLGLFGGGFGGAGQGGGGRGMGGGGGDPNFRPKAPV